MRLTLLFTLLLTACDSTAASWPTSTPAPRPLTIVALGDSLTQGDKDDSPEGGGFPRRLLPLVRQIRPQAAIVNLAQPGWTSRDLLYGLGNSPGQIAQAMQELRQAKGDKIALLWIGTNDLFYLYQFGNPTRAAESDDLNQFKRHLDELLRRLSETGAHVFVALLDDPARAGVRTGGALTGISADEWPRMSQQAQKYNDGIAIIAGTYGAAVVDMPATKIFTTSTLMVEDGIHPNARGYDALAQVWFDAIRAAVMT